MFFYMRRKDDNQNSGKVYTYEEYIANKPQREASKKAEKELEDGKNVINPYTYEGYIANKKQKEDSKKAEKKLEGFVGYKPTNNKKVDNVKNNNKREETVVCRTCGIF